MALTSSTIALYASGARAGHIEAALESSAKYVVLCLEDGTPEDQKLSARHLVKHALCEYAARPGVICIRINGCETTHWEEDIRLLFAEGAYPPRIRFPMAQGEFDVARTLDEIAKYGRRLLDRHLELMVESGECYRMLRPILRRFGGHIAAVTVGGEDLLTSLGSLDAMDRAKTHIVAIAREHGIPCLETTYMRYRDLHGLASDTRQALQRGFAGRSVIHPSHVAI